MNIESKSPADFNNEPQPIDPEVYKNLTLEQDEKMRDLMARDTNMTKAEALKIVMGNVEDKEE